MKDGTRATLQKGCWILLKLQEPVNKEIQILLDQGHIEKVNTMKDYVFIQPIVLAAKKDRPVEEALDPRALKTSIATTSIKCRI